MQLLLTGGTGFFGKALLRHWVAEAGLGRSVPKVTVLTRSPAAFTERHPELAVHPWLRLVQGDVLQPASLPAGQPFSHVLHAATDSTLGPQLAPLERYDQIVQGTRNLLDFALACGARRFLLTSSGGVYGPAPAGCEGFQEDHHGIPDPLEPANAYSIAKRASEHLCALYQARFGIETVIARCFAFVGRDLPLDAHFAIGNFIRDALQRPEIVVGGDGSPIRSYMDQRDLAIWLLALLDRAPAGQAFNVGSDQAISIHDVAHLVRDQLAPGKPVRVDNLKVLKSFRNLYLPSIDKARRTLGLGLTHALPDSILYAATYQK